MSISKEWEAEDIEETGGTDISSLDMGEQLRVSMYLFKNTYCVPTLCQGLLIQRMKVALRIGS